MYQLPVSVCPAVITLFNPSNSHYGSYLTGKNTKAQRAELRALVILSGFLRDDVFDAVTSRRLGPSVLSTAVPLEPTGTRHTAGAR